MNNYRLDNLMDWGTVLKELEELREAGSLDQHQDGLRRIIRYKRNWRLRECALECAGNVNLPDDELVTEVCSVICDDDSYPELRMRAAEVAAELVSRRAAGGVVPSFEGLTLEEKIRDLLAAPLNPLLARTLQGVLTRIEEDVRE
jgi:hypothetical protein